uniref:BTB domain-containing protein n=1 Tax=Acrobeloides nanus TaxID=290746 RepID=A0A914D151_9BILA
MLFGEFIEGQQKEVILKEPKYNEFMALLKIIYLEEEVTGLSSLPVMNMGDYLAKTCGPLLKLADFYQIRTVVQKCDKFLKNSSDVSMIEKLCLVDNYKLPETKNVCLNSVELKKPSFARDLTKKPEYGKISDKLKVSLLENALNSEQMYCDGCNQQRNYQRYNELNGIVSNKKIVYTTMGELKRRLNIKCASCNNDCV